MRDPIFDVYWEGPVSWSERNRLERGPYVLYSIHGTHPVYGSNVLLYIGRTARAGGQRLDEHEWWVDHECDEVVVRVGSVGSFTDWGAWEETERYPKAKNDLVEMIEALLIHANQPAYNSQGKQSLSVAEHFRVFNSGWFGRLLPECSTRYFED
jgi:hypothetical protein